MKREFKEIPLSDIVLTKDNKRKIDEKSQAFEELKASIEAGGVRVPVQVRIHPEKKDKYELRYGERRLRASKVVGLKTIPAIVTDSMTGEDAIDLTYIENKFRKDLKPLEEAAEVALLMERFGGDAKAVAKKIGRNAQWVYVRANIAKGLIKPWRQAVEGNHDLLKIKRWSLSHLSLIARLPERIQKDLFDYVEDNQWEMEDMSAADLEEMIGKTLHLLSTAKWQIDDETLVPKAGACTKCAKRCGHQPMLWFDSDDQVDAGDQCLDEFCWREKGMAWLERKAAELRKDHQDLMLVFPTSTSGANKHAIAEKLGTPLESYQYKTCLKSTKGAKPAMYVHGKGTGKLTYIKVNEFTSERGAGKPKGVPTPLNQRRQQLDAKRWAQVLIDLREKMYATELKALTYKAGKPRVAGLMAIAAVYGNKSIKWQRSGAGIEKLSNFGKEPLKQMVKVLKDKNAYEKATELLWLSIKPTLGDLLTYNGPITQTPKRFKEDAKWIAELIGVDIKLLFEDVSQRKGFTVPKSWAKLNTDGTSKKAKPAKKAKKSKTKKSKTSKAKKAKAKPEK